jgi:hypothetical protein
MFWKLDIFFKCFGTQLTTYSNSELNQIHDKNSSQPTALSSDFIKTARISFIIAIGVFAGENSLKTTLKLLCLVGY